MREREDPSPGPGEVLVRVAAIGLNFADLFVRAGVYPHTPKPPFVPGMEVSGTVEAVGSGVTTVSPGQRVAAVPLFGGHAEAVLVRSERVFPLPPGADLVQAAAMPVVFLTAWYALARAQIRAGERVAVTAAAGGVGTALLQLLAKRTVERAVRTLALVGSEKKIDLCRELGAGEACVYDSAEGAIDAAFAGRVDVVIDAIGGRTFRRLWRRLDRGGRYVLYGFAAAAGVKGLARWSAARELLAMGVLAPFRFVESCRTLVGFNLSLLSNRTGELSAAAEELFGRWRAGDVHPIIGALFPLERLPDAHRALAGRGTTGKVLVVVS